MIRAITLFAASVVLVACAEDTAPVDTPDTETPTALAKTSSAEGASVFFVTPEDGATVSSPFTVEFGLNGMAVAKAGNPEPQSGHHHLIIDAELPPTDQPIPANDNYRHFGDGSSSTELSLPPGEHSLQLLLGDHLHIPHEPPVYSDRITVTVTE